ncbi:FAD-dependent oxidoreductase [Lacinutrix sp. Hel_I_90]|uniref:flavin monoamine oxidase family protein n=1 Tax=Lacinutrix sp. Hel_I_90 TaxID=1249999 RepID=UPI0005C9EA4C|nr:FAD-dependent oxidoreductase [Lacinutrix sp. Hel_I_90]
MKTIKTDVLIIGAGLTGLTLAYYLKNSNLSVTIVEARTILGGRIKTQYNTNQAPIELGATWLIDQQVSALSLLKALDVPVFEQQYGTTAIYHPTASQAPQLVQLPLNNSVSYRVKGGTYAIIGALAERLSENTVQYNQNIQTIKLVADGLEASTTNAKYHCNHVVSTIPPLLFSKRIRTVPALPNDIQELLLNTHTWMHDAIRIGFTYKTAFWQTKDSSSTIYSNVGPINEFYDHSNADGNLQALSGFMNASFFKHTKAERKAIAIKQLQGYYGDIALDFECYEECVWKAEKYTTIESDKTLMPQTNNGHPLYQKTQLNNRLFIAGAETCSVFPGKMEGAITSAGRVYEQLKALYKL